MHRTINTVGYDTDALHDKAKALAQRLQYKLDKTADTCLFVDSTRLALKLPQFSLLYPDFSNAAFARRKAAGSKQGLIKACKPKPGMRIVDATAGWGRDAYLLASFGAEVVMLERHPVMVALLQDALAHQNPSVQHRLKLVAEEACTYLQALDPTDYPHTIYIDPMHPERTKSALVKKEMQALQQIVGWDQDALQLLHCALSYAKEKVVVKWPQKLKPLMPPDSSIPGKTIRFDVYS